MQVFGTVETTPIERPRAASNEEVGFRSGSGSGLGAVEPLSPAGFQRRMAGAARSSGVVVHDRRKPLPAGAPEMPGPELYQELGTEVIRQISFQRDGVLED